ncbi:MAG: helix-turn-helix domain-containing protein, partial [Verrucomicrobiota bacterium]
MTDKKKTVTLKDIAQKAGVSAGAVSFVLTNTHKKRRISPATVEKVRKIAAELGYQPNIAARNLRFVDPNEPMFVLAIITSTESPLTLVGHIFEALQKRIKENGEKSRFMINIATFELGDLKSVPGILDGAFFNGAVITNTSPADDEFLREAKLGY